MRLLGRTLLGAAMLSALSACNLAQDVSRAEAAVTEFRALQAAGDDNAVYEAIDPAFRESASLELVQQLNMLGRRFAAECDPLPESPSNWYSSATTQNGHIVELTYTRNCPSGDLSEKFVVKLDGEEARMAGYHLSGAAVTATLTEALQATTPAPTSQETTETDSPPTATGVPGGMGQAPAEQ
jgi:hypothetical protein